MSNIENHIQSSFVDEYSYSLNHIFRYLKYGGIIGMIFGGFKGSRIAGLRFYLEHQHYKMVTNQDWYIYFKMKNYAMLKGFTSQGIRMGFHIGTACMLFAIIEQSISRIRGLYNNTLNDQLFIQDSLNACLSVPIFMLIARGAYTMYYRKMTRLF